MFLFYSFVNPRIQVGEPMDDVDEADDAADELLVLIFCVVPGLKA